jgi:hypothetical protein
VSNYSRGSEWRRWDLHIHTPETNKNDQFEGDTAETKWNSYYDDINNYVGDGLDINKSIAVIGITDYLSIDNYKKVISDNKLSNSIKLILPNVEMRMTPVASNSPINIHCIFSPEIVDDLDAIFFNRLMFEYAGRKYSATEDELIKLGRAYSNDPTFDKKAAYKAGVEQFVVNSTTLQTVFESTAKLRENTIIVVSNKSTDGASGTRTHKDYFEGATSCLDALTQGIYRMSDMIFSSNPNDVEYFLGKRADNVAEVKRKCGSIKPCIHGSDAHSNDKIFEPDLRRYCWIKADPTFEGLKQAVFEPNQRVRISEFKPEEKQGYNVIDRVEFQDNDFQTEPIYFNENLNCVIGGKSTGKSILIQNLARTIDESQTSKHLNMSKRKTKNDVNLKVFWKDGKDESHKIIYIPQTYLNQLSDEKENQTEIDEWVEEILLKNPNINKSKSQLISYITEYKMDINKTLLDFLSYDDKIRKLIADKSEIGNKNGIFTEIEKLSIEKDKIVAQSEISENEIKLYDDAKLEIERITKQKCMLMNDKDNLDLIENLVEKLTIKFNFSKEINNKIIECQESILSTAKDKWLNTKTSIIKDINKQIDSFNEAEIPYLETVNKLKEKIESSEAVKVLTQKIFEEKAKIVLISELEETEKQVSIERNNLIGRLSESGNKYKHTYQTYAVIINNNTQETDGLLFQGETPFKSVLFSQKLSSVYDTRRTEFKQVIGDIDKFNESKYDEKLLKTIIEKTVDSTMALKNGYTIESALREILDNWYNIVYRVKMDKDFIDQMSPGKKALVLLKILISLAESKCPILIDQPEDDLDNRSIFNDLINFIKEKKIDRQIIVVTHNANIVLGSDSENIIIANQEGNDSLNKSKRFEYRSGSIENNNIIYKSDGKNKEDGVLNQHGIQHHICDILEGGETAFVIRKKKYRI